MNTAHNDISEVLWSLNCATFPRTIYVSNTSQPQLKKSRVFGSRVGKKKSISFPLPAISGSENMPENVYPVMNSGPGVSPARARLAADTGVCVPAFPEKLLFNVSLSTWANKTPFAFPGFHRSSGHRIITVRRRGCAPFNYRFFARHVSCCHLQHGFARRYTRNRVRVIYVSNLLAAKVPHRERQV